MDIALADLAARVRAGDLNWLRARHRGGELDFLKNRLGSGEFHQLKSRLDDGDMAWIRDRFNASGLLGAGAGTATKGAAVTSFGQQKKKAWWLWLAPL